MKKIPLRIFLIYLFFFQALSAALYMLMGHALVEKAHNGRSIPWLHLHQPPDMIIPLKYYWVKADIFFAIAIVLLGIIAFLLFMVITRPKEGILMAGVILLIWIAAETAFPILLYPNKPIFKSDPELGWKFIADVRGGIPELEVRNIVKINKQGYRDDDFGPEIMRKKRLFVIGDSFVANISVENQDVFTTFLEKNLPDISVMNLGVNGYSQVQEYLVMQKLLPVYRPQAIILLIYLRNDFLDNGGYRWLSDLSSPAAVLINNGTDIKIEPPVIENEPSTRFWHFPGILTLIRLMNEAVSRYALAYSGAVNVPTSTTPPEFYLGSRELTEDAFDLTSKKPSRLVRRLFRVMKIMIRKINALAESYDVPVAYVLAPSYLQVDPEKWNAGLAEFGEPPEKYELDQPNKFLMDFAREEGLIMYDLLPRMRNETAAGVVLYHPEEIHWTAEGNRVAGEEILKMIRENSVLSKALGINSDAETAA